jgi:guanylate kinase
MIHQDKLLIVTAPSGSGKTTIVRALLTQFPTLRFSISATTRARRPTEINGLDYYFLTNHRFEQLIRREAFLEYEEVYPGRFYGSLRSEVGRIQREGHHPIFDIDVQGAHHLKQRYGQRALALFIRPPSFEVLEQRLRHRQTESAADLDSRLRRAHRELTWEEKFDITVVNDQLDVAITQAASLVKDYFGFKA